MLLSATPRKGSGYWELEAAEGYGTVSLPDLEGKYCICLCKRGRSARARKKPVACTLRLGSLLREVILLLFCFSSET